MKRSPSQGERSNKPTKDRAESEDVAENFALTKARADSEDEIQDILFTKTKDDQHNLSDLEATARVSGKEKKKD